MNNTKHLALSLSPSLSILITYFIFLSRYVHCSFEMTPQRILMNPIFALKINFIIKILSFPVADSRVDSDSCSASVNALLFSVLLFFASLRLLLRIRHS